MLAKDFKKLLEKKSADEIKHEYMLGKHNTLTDRQLGKICELGSGHGGCAFKYKKRGEKNDKTKCERTTRKGFFNYLFKI